MSTEPAPVGGCETPTCTEIAEEITPEGYVCGTCADHLEAQYEQHRERDADAWEDFR